MRALIRAETNQGHCLLPCGKEVMLRFMESGAIRLHKKLCPACRDFVSLDKEGSTKLLINELIEKGVRKKCSKSLARDVREFR
jgi:hypothetical protein